MSIIGTTKANPPRPHLKYRVGLTGHLGVDHPTEVRAELNRVLAGIKAWVGGQAPASGYCSPHSELILVAALARGVDSLGAHVARELGYTLHAVLPFAAADYRKDFTEPSDRLQYDDLLEAAEHVLELDGLWSPENDTEHKAERDAAYLAAGETVLRSCDLLIAVWDQGRPLKTGGTTDIVSRASAMGVPVVWIDAKACRETCWWRESHVVDFELLEERVTVSLRPPERSGLFGYYSETEHRWLWGVSFELLVSALALKIPHPRIWARRYLSKSLEDWRPLDSDFPDAAAKHFQPYDQWADNLAIHYSGRTRGVLASVLLLSTVGLCLGLTLHKGSPPMLKSVSAILGLFSVAIFAWARHGEFNRKWIEYRTLSEMLRNSALLWAIGGSLRVRSHFQGKDYFSSRWAEWYIASVARSFGVIPIKIDKHYLERYWRMLRSRLSAQAEYHERRSLLYASVKRRLDILTALFFLAGAIAAAIELFESLRMPVPEGVQNVANYAWVASVISAALAAFSNFGGFDRLAIVSRAVSRKLYKVVVELENLEHLTQAILCEKAQDAADIMMTEHEDWYFFYSLRDMEKPL